MKTQLILFAHENHPLYGPYNALFLQRGSSICNDYDDRPRGGMAEKPPAKRRSDRRTRRRPYDFCSTAQGTQSTKGVLRLPAVRASTACRCYAEQRAVLRII